MLLQQFHRQRIFRSGKWALLLAVCMLMGCGGSGSAPANLPQTTPPAVSDNLQLTLAIDKSVYKAGEPIVYTFTLKNLTNSEKGLIHDNYYFNVVQNATGQKLNLPDIRVYDADLILSPNDTNTFQDQWAQDYYPNSTSRIRVPPGTYTITGSNTYLTGTDATEGKIITTAPLTITIQ